MQNRPNLETLDRRSFGQVAGDLSTSLKNLVQSEIHLAKAELSDSVGRTASHLGMTAAFGAVAALGILPFMAFLVIGLGRLLNDNFWLSALIVSIVFFAV